MMTNKLAIKILLGLVSAVILFHLCIIVKIIPYEITWGGRLQNDTEMYVSEAVSILINLFLGFLLLIKGAFIRPYLKRGINAILWVFFALFLLNTIGNLFAKTTFEQSFAVLTLIFAALIGFILRNKRAR
ncbi:hypothetical protein [Edaphocola aurantiacus]|uniref:hypothetical protein n=1 Tax=Edaphocola aurantiacus TaxID=2601682 RepID=UPI001C979FD2|nr:hypothetical protein [Edaphocola aurantiacus]